MMKNKTNNAKVHLKPHFILELPKQGNALMLFFEWFSQFNGGGNWFHGVENGEETFRIRLNMPQAQYEHAAEYINANL